MRPSLQTADKKQSIGLFCVYEYIYLRHAALGGVIFLVIGKILLAENPIEIFIARNSIV